jgi:hypothetical protein
MFYKLITFAFIAMLSSCYSFKGISIPPDVNTFYVENFQLSSSAIGAPGDLGIRYTESLRAKIRNESRLKYKELDADIEISGNIDGFNIRPEAPQAGNTVALNKFEIVISVNFVNNKDDAQTWKQSFSFFRTFPSDQDFQSAQDGLITEVFRQLNEDVFNKAFTTW